MKIGIVVIAHDGLQSILTGVGVVVNSFVESFPRIKKRCGGLLRNETSLICIAPYIDKKSRDFHKNVRKITREICKNNKGKLYEIKTLSSGDSQKSIWGNHKQWKVASLNAAKKVNEIKKDYDKLIIFSHDTIFSLVSIHLKDTENICTIWVPHSLGKVFEDESTNSHRIKIEKESVEDINSGKNKYLGSIGGCFEKILVERYFLDKGKILHLTNGLNIDSQRFKVEDSDLRRIKRYNIPKNKKLIFSCGRCVYQKGFDRIIKASKIFLEENKDYHLVLLMPTETSEKDYVKKIKKDLSLLPKGQYTTIFEFDSVLPKYMFSNKALKIVIFASRFEGNPISPLEAKIYCKNEISLIYSNISPLKRIFDKDSSGIMFNGNEENLYLKMKKSKKTRMSKKSLVPDIAEVYSLAIDSLF